MILWGLKTWNDQSVQETDRYLYIFLPLIHLNAQLSWQQLVHDGSTCSGIVDACAEAICRTYTSLIVYTIHLVLSVYILFTLKAVGPIDCHYMTDRLQWFELKKNSLCSEETKSPTSDALG